MNRELSMEAGSSLPGCGVKSGYTGGDKRRKRVKK